MIQKFQLSRTRKLFNICLYLLFIPFAWACSPKLTNSHNTTALSCQVSIDRTQSRFLKVLDIQGSALGPEQTSNLVAEFLSSQGELSYPSITPGSCVEIPNKSGQLAVFDNKNKASLYLLVEGDEASFLTGNLQKNSTLKFDSLCQGDTQYANARLKRNWSVTSDGPGNNIRISVQLRNISNDLVTQLYEKPFGEDIQFPNFWSTETASEGQYRLEVLQHPLNKGLSETPDLVSFAKECPVTIIHHAPTLLAITDGTKSIPIIDKDNGFVWQSNSDDSDIYTCTEERSEIPQEVKSGNSCQAKTRCRDTVQFTKSERVVPKNEGLFNIFAYSQDKAQNKSEVECRTVIFSSQAPQFDLSWKKSQWNRPDALLNEAVPTIGAKITGVFHPNISETVLQKSLECKAEVVLQSTETVTTPRLVCSEGLCKNQTLDVYRPCSQNFGIALYDFWKSSYSSHATIRLKVRMSDGANHLREKAINIIVNSDQWEKISVELPSTEDSAPSKLHEDFNGNIMFLAYSDINMWKDDKWINVTPKDEVGGLIKGSPIQIKNREIYYVTSIPNGDQTIFKWTNEKWQPFSEHTKIDTDSSTVYLAHPGQGFWIHSESKSYFVDEERIVECPRLPKEFSTSTRFSLDKNQTIWAVEGKSVYFQDSLGNWQQIATESQTPLDTSFSYFVDRNSHLWKITYHSQSELITEIERIDGDQKQSYPNLVQNLIQSSSTVKSFLLNAKYSPVVAQFAWDETSQSWQENPIFDGIGDHIDQGFYWNQDEIVWTSTEGRVFIEHNGQLQHLPHPMSQGEMPFISQSKDYWVYGFNGMARYRWNPWSDKVHELDDMENVFKIFQSNSGSMRGCSRNGKVWELGDGIWTLYTDVSKLDSSKAYACLETLESDLLIQTNSSIWMIPKGAQKPVKIASSHQGSGPDGFHEDSQGHIWFACLDNANRPSICSFAKGVLNTDPLPDQLFTGSHEALCTLEVENSFYVFGNGISKLYMGKNRTSKNLEKQTIPFPDGSDLSIDACYKIEKSTSLILSLGEFYLWDNLNLKLKPIPKLEYNVYLRILTSTDGNLYLANEFSVDRPSHPELIPERIKRGSVYRLSPDGALTEILPFNLRNRSYDALNFVPSQFFTDKNGMLWGVSMSYLTFKERLIQFSVPWTVL